MASSALPRRTNHLAGETSPYLLQHAANPVDWYPWGPEALERARREDRPILLSIGYAACHWCHVMERESFEDEAIAALMNEHFVCIKVDREERPDLDDLYMAATVAMSGSGGWPMTVFLTPEQRPFFAGTYYPPTDRYGRPGFPALLRRIAEAWRSERESVADQARELTEHIAAQSRLAPPTAVGAEVITAAVEQLAAQFDARWGGFGGAPKFPAPEALRLLLREHARCGDAELLHMVTRTLDGMKDGGLLDHLGGGFARYSTDERWLVPHFEKMLYDNAGLARVYVEAWQVTGDPEYRRVAEATLGWMAGAMQGPDGGLFSATDADSEGVEGRYFVWTLDQVTERLEPRDAEAFALYYDVTPEGNWEGGNGDVAAGDPAGHGSNVLHTPRPAVEVARELGMPVTELEERLARARAELLAARAERVPPLLDDKVLTAWNALAIGALAEAGRVLGEPRWTRAAERAAGYVLGTLRRPDGGLFRTARGGRAHLDGYLEDYAYLVSALVDLHEATGAKRWLGAARELAERLIADFTDEESGAFFHTARHHEPLLVRSREGHDGALPNPNAVAAHALGRLAVHLAPAVASGVEGARAAEGAAQGPLGAADLRERAQAALRAHGRAMERAPRAFVASLAAVDFLLAGPVELVLVGAPDDPRTAALEAAVARVYLPHRVIARVHRPGSHDADAAARADGAAGARALTAGKGLVGGAPALYVCRDFTCRAPVTDPALVAAALRAGVQRAEGEREEGLGLAPLGGSATQADTAALAARHVGTLPRGYTLLGRTGLTVSRLGFGGYRVDDGDPDHRAALEAALLAGVNLIDTSSNYSEGRSERLVGEVLRALAERGEPPREGVVVVSKLGYVQGPALELARRREQAGRAFPGMVELGADHWHCLGAEWLGEALGHSLERLGLTTLDVCLLHNPEYLLDPGARWRDGGPGSPSPGTTGRRGRDPAGVGPGGVPAGEPAGLEDGGTPPSREPALRARFRAALTQAFVQLEAEVKRGRLRCYGVSCNTLVAAPGDPRAVTLAELLAAAEAAGGAEHHLRVVQLPLNLVESRAALDAHGGGAPLLEQARAAGLGVLTNRPLNVILETGLMRLAEPPALPAGPPLETARAAVATLEAEFRERFAPALRAAPGSAPPTRLFDWAAQLGQLGGAAGGGATGGGAGGGAAGGGAGGGAAGARTLTLEQWRDLERNLVIPRLRATLAQLARVVRGNMATAFNDWRQRYVPALDALLLALARQGAATSAARLAPLRAALTPAVPSPHREAPLSQQALGVLLGLPGVDTVLIGMRRASYVQDAVAALQRPALAEAVGALRAVRGAAKASAPR